MQQLQDQCDPDRCVASEMHLGENDSAVSFTPNRRLLTTHACRDVHFSNRRTQEAAIDFHVDRRYLAAEPVEQIRHEATTCAAHTIERDVKIALPFIDV